MLELITALSAYFAMVFLYELISSRLDKLSKKEKPREIPKEHRVELGKVLFVNSETKKPLKVVRVRRSRCS
jgi:hypothetical protein